MGKLKEIAIVSGKGGTGKTSLTASLSVLFKDKIMADCDVDAANLHLVLNPRKIVRQSDFTGGSKAEINNEKCVRCGICIDACRFGAISSNFRINEFMCEGCGACFVLCPEHAVDFSVHTAGTWYVTETDDGDRFVYAELFPGEDNSGKLVAAVRNEARIEARETGKELIIIDGPPGIGCPVISSITSAKLVIIVTEPTPSGIHDLERITALTGHFKIKTAIVINKYDINDSLSGRIRKFCGSGNYVHLGDIPYDMNVTEAQRSGQPVVMFSPECEAGKAVINIYNKLQQVIEGL